MARHRTTCARMMVKGRGRKSKNGGISADGCTNGGVAPCNYVWSAVVGQTKCSGSEGLKLSTLGMAATTAACTWRALEPQ